MIGKYMIDSPEVAGDYYQKIADRIAVSLAIFVMDSVVNSRHRTPGSEFASELLSYSKPFTPSLKTQNGRSTYALAWSCV